MIAEMFSGEAFITMADAKTAKLLTATQGISLSYGQYGGESLGRISGPDAIDRSGGVNLP